MDALTALRETHKAILGGIEGEIVEATKAKRFYVKVCVLNEHSNMVTKHFTSLGYKIVVMPSQGSPAISNYIISWNAGDVD